MTAVYASAVLLAVQDIVRAGIPVTHSMEEPEATNGNKFLNDGKTFLQVINGSVGAITVTVDTTGLSAGGMALADLVLTVAATGDGDGLDKQFIGPFTRNSNQTDGYVWAVCSAVTDVLIGAFRVINP
jgi:hypothetical protein